MVRGAKAPSLPALPRLEHLDLARDGRAVAGKVGRRDPRGEDPRLARDVQLTVRFPWPTVPAETESTVRPSGAVTVIAVLEIFESEKVRTPVRPPRSRVVASSSTGGVVR